TIAATYRNTLALIAARAMRGEGSFPAGVFRSHVLLPREQAPELVPVGLDDQTGGDERTDDRGDDGAARARGEMGEGGRRETEGQGGWGDFLQAVGLACCTGVDRSCSSDIRQWAPALPLRPTLKTHRSRAARVARCHAPICAIMS